MTIPLWQRLTLRHRTVVIITLFMWFTGIVVGMICRSSLERLMYRQTDVELQDDAIDFLSLVDGQAISWSDSQSAAWNRRVATHPLHRLFIRILEGDGDVVWESITAPHPFPSTLDENSPEIQSAGSFRVVHYPVRILQDQMLPSGMANLPVPMTLQVGCSLDLVSSTIRQFDLWLITGLGILSLATPLIAWFLASRLLEPLRQLAHDTDSLQIDTLRLIQRTRNGDEIDRLAETVNTLLTRVRTHLQSNEDWMANSAHQLRGPLAAIVSNVEVVAGRIPDGKSKEMLERVLSECEHLKRLVNQLLFLGEAKADRHHPIRERIEWDEMVAKASDFFEALAHAHEIDIHFPRLDPCVVLANPEHLRYVIHNLIDNAIKYTPERGRIDVSILRNDANRTCTLLVCDNGIGISEADQDKLCRRFYRSDSGRDPEQTPRGSGLGLHIVRSIVDTLQGKLEIASKLGEGTRVSVELPMANEETPRSAKSKTEASHPV